MDIVIMLSDKMKAVDGHSLQNFVEYCVRHSMWSGHIEDVELNYGCEQKQ